MVASSCNAASRWHHDGWDVLKNNDDEDNMKFVFSTYITDSESDEEIEESSSEESEEFDDGKIDIDDI